MASIKKEDQEKIIKAIRDTIRIFAPRKLKELKNVKYYFSEQWSEQERAERMNDTPPKPTLTFNQIKRFVNWLYGVIKQMDLEVKAVPRHIVSESSANLISGLIRTVLYDERNRDAIDTAMFDAFIRGVGFVWIYPDFYEDPSGIVKIKRIDPLDVYFDTLSEEKDFSDARYLFFIEKLTEEEIKQKYPDGYKKIKDKLINLDGLIDYLFVKQADDVMVELRQSYSDLLKSPAGQLYPVVHYRERIFIEEPALYNTKTRVYITFPKVKEEAELYAQVLRLNEAQGENVYRVESVSVKRIRHLVLIGDTIIEHIDNPYGISYYDVVPFFCYKIGRNYQGFVDDLIDAQDEFNWRKSLLVEILRDMPIDSFWIPKGAMTDVEIEVAQDKLSKRKQLIPIRYEYGQPMPIVSDALNKLTALIQMEQILRIDIKELGGMVDALMGIVPRKLQSGKAIQALQQWGFIPFETIFSNYFHSLYLTGNLVWKIARFIYSERDVIRLLGETGEYEFVDVNIDTEIGRINQILADDYDVYLTVRAKTADEMTEKFMELLQLRQLGIPIPDEFLIMYSKVPNKKQLIEQIMQMKQLLLQQTQQKEGEEQ